MAVTIKHAKTDTIADWTQSDLDAQIAAGNYPAGTVLADIVLPSDWNNDHTISGTLAIANGGTGQTTANAAINALLPSQTSNVGKVLTTDGTNTSWEVNGTGTVTSVTGTAPVSVATGTTTPVISMAAATGSVNGYLTSTDWTTFNSKAPATSGTSILYGNGSGGFSNVTVGSGLSFSTGTLSSTAVSMVYPGAGIPNSTGSAWGTSYTTSGSGTVVALATGASLTTPIQVSYETWTGISAPTYTEGRVWYDTNAHALSYYNDVSSSTVHIGQDLQVKVINNTGSTIANGTPVYITSTSSGQTYPNIALAKADVAATSAVIGLTNGSIANGAVGYVTSQGGIDGVNTGSFTVGQVLYLSPYSAGQLMNTIPPTGITVQVGVVSYVDSSAGKIYVKQTTPLAVPASIITGQVALANGGTNANLTAVNGGAVYSTGSALAITAAGTSGQVLTSNGAGAPTWTTPTTGTVTSVTGTSPIASTGGATPAISISQATTSTNGYLSSTDWNTFNNKQPAGTYVTSVSATSPVTSSGGTTPTIAMPAATTSVSGYLTSTDWNTFNNKGSGTVTAVSVASANGFAGTSSGGATPALTLTTSITGMLKGNGTAISAGTAGTDYVAPGTATTFTAAQTFNGSSSTLAAVFANAAETTTVSATAATGTINYDVTTQSVLYYTTNASANFTLNFRASSGTSLNTAMATGQTVTVVFLCTNGATAYYNNAVTVDGNSVTPKYQGGSAWTSGNASAIDAYSFTIIKTGSAAFTVLTSQTQFK